MHIYHTYDIANLTKGFGWANDLSLRSIKPRVTNNASIHLYNATKPCNARANFPLNQIVKRTSTINTENYK